MRRSAPAPSVSAQRPSPATRPPQLFFWGARTLYLGQALGLSAHRNAIAVLCASLDGPFGVARNPRQPDAGTITCRTALIPPNTLHHLSTGSGTMAFLYVDARSNDYRHLAASMTVAHERFGSGIANETACLDVLASLRNGKPWREARDALASTLGLAAPVPSDDRITDALRRMRDEPAAAHDLDNVAAAAGLSPSRFQHLFKEQTGVPFRRYRIWMRMGAAVRAIAAGNTLTEAALAAGFSSSAHFSAAFREMFGLSPSQLAHSQPVLHGIGPA
jgi:AraC-like DNA-binding protein